MLPQRTHAIGILFIFLLITVETVFADASLPKVSIKSAGSVPEGYLLVPDSIKISADFLNVAFVAYSDSTHNIVQINDQTSPVYYAVHPGTPTWDPFSKKCAYIAFKNKSEAVIVVGDKIIENLEYADNFIFSTFEQRYACRAQKNNRQFVIVDGKPEKPYEGIPIKDNFTFSPDSKRFFYVGFKNNACVAVIDGREEPASYNFIENVRFGLDSAQYAYKARTEQKAKGAEKWCVVRNGRAGAVYDKIFDLIFSPDSQHLAYTAIKGREMVMVLNGHELDAHDRVGLPVFSFDSKTFAFAYVDKERWYIRVNDKKSDAFDQIYKFYFSPDSEKYAFFAKTKGKWVCVIDGKTGPGFNKAVETFKFSPDSSRYIYAGADEKGSQVITDGNPGRNYLSVGEPYFSPDSHHVVYRAVRKGDEQFITVLDGKESAKAYNGIGQYTFSPDSKHLAYPAIISVDQSVMVVDGVEECMDKKFKILSDPYFSPEGDFIVYHARAAEEKWYLIVNGRVLPETYGGFYKGTPIIFDSPNRFHTMGIKPGGTEFVVIDVEIPADWRLKTKIQ